MMPQKLVHFENQKHNLVTAGLIESHNTNHVCVCFEIVVCDDSALQQILRKENVNNDFFDLNVSRW